MPEIDFEARRAWFSRHLDALAAAGTRILVAEMAGAPAGLVTLDVATGRIDQLAVHPEAQGRGLADALVARCKVLCADGLALDVNAGNPRARRFYARHGFRVVGDGVNPRSGLPTLALRWDGPPRAGRDSPIH